MQSSNASVLHTSPRGRQPSRQLEDENEVDSNVERPKSTRSIDDDADLSQRTMRMSTRGLSATDGSLKSRISVSTRGLCLENDAMKTAIQMSTRGLEKKHSQSLGTLAMSPEESCPIPKYIAFETPPPEEGIPAPVDLIVIQEPIQDPPKRLSKSSTKPSSRKPAPVSSSTASLATAELTLSSSTGSTAVEKKSRKKKWAWFQKFSSSSTALQSSKSSLKGSDGEKVSRRFSLAQLTGRSSSALVA
jgi:hypothetical protein